jgi:hypothetical protein
MIDTQLYLAIGVPVAFNAILITLPIAMMAHRFEAVEKRFESINQRFDDMRDLWRAELHRVEEVLDARLTHIGERIGR